MALRKQRPARSRLSAAAIGAGCSVLFLLIGAMTGSRTVGRTLEQSLCLIGLASVLRAPMLTAGVLAEERRNQTLGLLFLSGLGAGEVFTGKFLSSALVAFTNLLALFPMLALPFLTGGVSFDVFLATVVALPSLMLFALALSLLASVLTRDEGTARILAVALGALLCFLAPVIHAAQSHFSPAVTLSPWWLRSSPAYGPYLAWNGLYSGFHPGERTEFWQNLGMTLAWSALALGIAAVALKRLWRDREEEGSEAGCRGRWREFWHGGRESRSRLARLWLEKNPFVWLAGRDHQPAMVGWVTTGGIVLAWLLCWAAWPKSWPGVLNFFVTATLLNSLLAWLTRNAAAKLVGGPRRDGAYELLLTTPLDPSAIVWGTVDALQWRFRTLADFVLGLEAFMMLGGLVVRPWNVRSLIVYLLIWVLSMAWTRSIGRSWSRVFPVMWVSLNCGRPAHAVWRASGLNSWSWIWIAIDIPIFVNGPMGRAFQRFPTGSLFELVFVSSIAAIWLVSWLPKALLGDKGRVADMRWDAHDQVWLPRDSSKMEALARRFEIRLIREFREIAREPLPDPSDPRFKKWNVQERFPWGWEMTRQQLHERLARSSDMT